MDRRDFLRTTFAAAAASLVPSWVMAKPPINLAAFCLAPEEVSKFKMTQPFVQIGAVDDAIGRKPWQQKFGLPGTHAELFRYATDGRICVRVPGEQRDKDEGQETKLPPACGLPWTHEWLCRGKWLPWPRENYLLAEGSLCPLCHGTGDLAGIPEGCEPCDGTGHYWGETILDEPRLNGCKSCKGGGVIIKDPCPTCRGIGDGVFPGIQPLGPGFITSEYDTKIRQNLRDVEWFLPKEGIEQDRPVKIRFDGGLALLMALDPQRTMESLVTK
jgi:hypothetical protein